MSFIIRILGNSLALYVASIFVPGLSIQGGITSYLIAGIILGLLNLIVRPILKVISMPLIMLTLGLFTLVINAILLWFVDYMFNFLTIQDLTALVWATIIISVVNFFVSISAKII